MHVCAWLMLSASLWKVEKAEGEVSETSRLPLLIFSAREETRAPGRGWCRKLSLGMLEGIDAAQSTGESSRSGQAKG